MGLGVVRGEVRRVREEVGLVARGSVGVTQRIYVHKLHASYRPIGHTRCVIMHFVLFWNGILSVSYFVFVSCINFIKLFTLYGISILIP